MEAACLWVDQRRERVDVGAAQLFKLALFKDDGERLLLGRGELVPIGGELFKCFYRCAVVARGGFLEPARREAQLAEEHLAELLGAAQS